MTAAAGDRLPRELRMTSSATAHTMTGTAHTTPARNPPRLPRHNPPRLPR
ncbi:hypothetical protein OHA72_19550 [Dactylosporangium sp. NBC_01737]|nr:hypothetical protein OHA72_19550 [Dactylosporangium sp. NBC_01737]